MRKILMIVAALGLAGCETSSDLSAYSPEQRAALAAAFLQSGGIRFQPLNAADFQRPIYPAYQPPVIVPQYCTTTAGPNTGAFGVVTANTSCY